MADWFEASDDSEREARRESCTDDVSRPEERLISHELRTLANIFVVRGGGCWLISEASGLDFGVVVSLYLGVVLLMMKIKR